MALLKTSVKIDSQFSFLCFNLIYFHGMLPLPNYSRVVIKEKHGMRVLRNEYYLLNVISKPNNFEQ